jgi:predicted GIY-YIG superfamily endonuclease
MIVTKRIGFFTTQVDTEKEKKMKEKKEKDEGVFYLLKDIDNNLYKIGITKNIKNRVSSFKSMSSTKLDLIYEKKILKSKYHKSVITEKLVKYNYHGDWYNLNETLIDSIKLYIGDLT